MSDCIGKEFFFPLFTVSVSFMIEYTSYQTYCTKGYHLFCVFQSDILRYALEAFKVENKGWKNLPVVLLPLSYCIQIFSRWLLCFRDRLLRLLSYCNTFAFEGGLLRSIGLSSKHTPFGGRLSALLTWWCSQWLMGLEHLLLSWWWLPIRLFALNSGIGSFLLGRSSCNCSVGRVDGIGIACQRHSSTRHSGQSVWQG
jgi:hypothetical protein